MSESSLPLVTRARGQDAAAVEALLVRHLPGLHGWLRLRMGAALRARETPEDLVQSVAREVLADLGRFEWRGEAAFRHWLYLKAQHKLVDKARFVAADCRSPANERPTDDRSDGVLAALATGTTPSRDLQSHEAVARIERAFAELAADHQEAISLRRLCGMDYAAIAAHMQRSEGAVRNLVHRGLSQLALRLGELRRSASGGGN
ncbi:MAG: sigma-70 family RNA polymerase sigma factor [Planctomycetes bacterium]|nr:sigma-70 family RNA polymerase sigma factor [Planctomycetota bacterium]